MRDKGFFLGMLRGVDEVRIRSGSWRSKEYDDDEGMSTREMMCTYNWWDG